MFWILVGVALATLVYFVLIKPFNYWSDRGVPQYKFWTTWFETLLGFIPYRSISEAVQKMYDDFPEARYNGLYQFYMPTLSLRDPDLIKQISVKDFDHFVDHYQFVPEDSEPLWEKNLFSLKGDKWRDMRATLSPSFTSSKMKVMFGLISECSKQFVQYFQEQGSKTITVEMKDAFTRFTNDVIASAAFGLSCDSLKDRDNQFYLMGKEITNFDGLLNNFKFVIMMIMPRLAKALGFKFFKDKATKFFRKTVKDNLEAREKNGIVRPDMIHLLMEARKGRSKGEKSAEENVNEGFAVVEESSLGKEEKLQKEQLTDEDITAQALIFFFAGFDSVSTLMCFMAHELAVNSDVQQRLQTEIDDISNECAGSVSYETLMNMKYMDMVVSETLRKWPGGVVVDRVCVKPYTIQPARDGEKPVHLRKGDAVWLPIFGLHRDPQFFPEPDRFDPERFSEENKADIIPYTYMPFGSGPRSCIGNRFALMETKLVFFYLLSNFDITIVEKSTVPLKVARSQFQLSAEGGFWLGLKPREKEF